MEAAADDPDRDQHASLTRARLYLANSDSIIESLPLLLTWVDTPTPEEGDGSFSDLDDIGKRASSTFTGVVMKYINIFERHLAKDTRTTHRIFGALKKSVV